MDQIRSYKLIKFLNRGAHGQCHLYENTRDALRQKVVIKSVKMDCSEEQLAEAEILKKCRHPFIIGLYECFSENSTFFIVMQFAEGGSLGEEITRRKKQEPKEFFAEDEIFMYFGQILMALDYLHSQNVIHRDLKPENILLNKSKKLAKLADFGISKVLGDGKDDRSVIGTACYIPPEVYNRDFCGKEVDIWALGCILYELIELERTFNGNPAYVTNKVIHAQYPPLTQTGNQFLKMYVADCLKVNKMFRPKTRDLLRSGPMLVTVARLVCMVSA